MVEPDHAGISSAAVLRLSRVFLLCVVLLPGLHGENLQCYYCPLQPVHTPCQDVLTECLSGQQCATVTGRYGAYHGVFSKGCIPEEKCLATSSQIMQGSNISLQYSCCSSDFCNSTHHWTCNHRLLVVTAIALLFFSLG